MHSFRLRFCSLGCCNSVFSGIINDFFLFLSAVITTDDGWTASLDNTPVSKNDNQFIMDLSSVDSDIESNSQKIAYWNAPKELLGNQVS